VDIFCGSGKDPAGSGCDEEDTVPPDSPRPVLRTLEKISACRASITSFGCRGRRVERGRLLMKHKVKVKVPVEKRGLFGIKKTVMETRTIEVDHKTYKKMMKERKNRPYSLEEMMFYDWIFEDW
jgi:hypothetical protein